MKRFLLSGLLIVLFSINALAKSATVHITIKNFKGFISIYDPELRYDLTKKKVVNVVLDAHQTASYMVNIDQPGNLIIYFTSDKFFNYSLFLSPGDDLFLTADFAKKDHQVTVTAATIISLKFSP